MNQQLFNEVTEWQKKTFPQATTISKLHHLKQEVEELFKAIEYLDPEDPEDHVKPEFADCFLLLFGAAKAYGMTYEEITKCIEDKFEINKLRKWGEADKDGVVNHVKEESKGVYPKCESCGIDLPENFISDLCYGCD